MTVLSIPAVLSLALHCAPSVDPAMIAGIAQRESGRSPYAIHDNATGHSYSPETASEGVRIASTLVAAGHSTDMGIAQINSSNLGLLGLGLADAFDPCRNIGAAARLLALFSAYNTGSPTRGMTYAAAVSTATRAVKNASPPAPVPVAPELASPFTRPGRAARDVVFSSKGEQ
jgi:type IV secretion system protein VirB1